MSAGAEGDGGEGREVDGGVEWAVEGGGGVQVQAAMRVGAVRATRAIGMVWEENWSRVVARLCGQLRS